MTVPRVLLYDPYGHGQSGPAREKMSPERYLEQLRGLTYEAGMESATVIGFSLGGTINRKLAVMAPERLHALAIQTSPHGRTPEAQKQMETHADGRAVHGIRELVAPMPPINCPTLVASTENDTGSTPGMARVMHDEMPDSTLENMPELKHLGLPERPDLFEHMFLDLRRRAKAEVRPVVRWRGTE